jgi:hypothetical protein
LTFYRCEYFPLDINSFTIFFSYQAKYFFSFRAIIYIPRKINYVENPVAEADDEKLDTTEHRLSSLVPIAASRSAAAAEEEIKKNSIVKTIVKYRRASNEKPREQDDKEVVEVVVVVVGNFC